MQFGQEWVRPYLSLHEAVPGGGPTSATVTWVIPRVVQDGGLPAGPEPLGEPVVLAREAHHGVHRAHPATKRRRTLRITAAVATLIGSAAIAGTYAFSRDHDAGQSTAQAPATRLDLLEAETEPSAAPEPSRSPGPLPSSPRRTAPATGTSPAGAPSTAAPSAPAENTPTGSNSAPAAGRFPGAPSTAAPSASPSADPAEKPTLRRHDSGPQVVELQQRLAQIGAWSRPQRGRYDQHLQHEVQRFQAKHGVRGDPPGVYGPATRRVLESMTP
ncbi:peptidoglycan-binding domain-containing protein [Streptomyces xanthophaeus]|uniref:peptidoglycan-binding domain-containing protein n=1 Tax=Streptomyces xanthophaeus TaxID=67385 RepID=UPI0004CC9659|nr:peptidoglycan-binding domain-containing protein [Streptomyces xanthophaeus]